MDGFRGYVSSRLIGGARVPQHVQNLVIREYCKKTKLHFLLSSTEVAMPNAYLIFEQLLNELFEIAGIVCYSIHQLPQDFEERRRMIHRVIRAKRTVHFAIEEMVVNSLDGIMNLETILAIESELTDCLTAEDLKRACQGEI